MTFTTGNWSHDTDATTLCPTPLTLPLKVVCSRNSVRRERNIWDEQRAVCRTRKDCASSLMSMLTIVERKFEAC